MKGSSRIETLTMVLLSLWFVSALYLQTNIGLADNGDFTRSMRWITSGPAAMDTNWPAIGTDDWTKRFVNYWIPYWKLEWHLTRPKTSAILLWLPGALLNYLVYSPSILYSPSLSLLPKLLSLGTQFLLFVWIRHVEKHRLLLILGLGVPACLLLTSTDYIAYFNGFYQETASFVFLFLFLASILFLRHRPSFKNLLLSLALLACLTTSKTSNTYWPLLGIPLMFFVMNRNFRPRLRLTVPLVLILALMFTLGSFLFTNGRSGAESGSQFTHYNSLFFGVLNFSDNPSEHLRALGFEATDVRCVGASAFTTIGTECHARCLSQLTYLNTVGVILREPGVMPRMMKYVLDNMQTVSVGYLGKYAADDPRAQAASPITNLDTLHDVYQDGGSWNLLGLWVNLKQKLFPRGYILAGVLVAFAAWFIVGLRYLKQSRHFQDLAIVGLLATIACVVDMAVAILGDGKQELIKHLFLSNLLFDIALLAFLSSILVCFLNWVDQRKKLKPPSILAF